ncbi:MAG: hypothetical protein ACUVRD_06670 [Bacteroidia bacterium]
MAVSRKPEVATYVGAFIFAAGLWTLEKLDKPQVGVFEIGLCNPSPYLSTPTKVRLQVEASGYSLILLFLRLPAEVPILTWVHQSPSDWLKAYLPSSEFKILAVDPPREKWLNALQARKVPVHLHAKVMTPPQAELLSTPLVSPESVYTLGSSKPVWEGALTIESGESMHEIELQPACAFYPNRLRVHFVAEKMLQVRLALKPRIVGEMPTAIRIYPQKIFLTYKVPENSPHFPQAQDFDIYVDITRMEPEDSVIYPILARSPASIKDIQWHPKALRVKRIHYLR